MVTRKDTRGRVCGPDQQISVTETLGVCTRNGAFASFEGNIKGSLTAAKFADVVILEKDPPDVAPQEIIDIKVVQMMLWGAARRLIGPGSKEL